MTGKCGITIYMPSIKTLEKELEHHKDWIELQEKIFGYESGRLFFAISILSDIEEMVGGNYSSSEITKELEEVKALIMLVIKARHHFPEQKRGKA